MDKSEQVTDFWTRFCGADGGISADEPYQIWYFGDSQAMADELVSLVIDGTKTATASLLSVDEIQPETAPVERGYSVVTDFAGSPKCVIRTEELRLQPFEDVDEHFAFDEGEGDRTLENWRKVHQAYFSREAEEVGVNFSARSMVVCERFKLIYAG
jgi:uncharacterized protein YhfF